MVLQISELTIIVPTYNERENVEALVERLDTTLTDVSWDVLFVDDQSPDGTADVVKEIGIRDTRVKCLLRIGRRGLSSACIEGMMASDSTYLAVMDGDLQHDETILPVMLMALKDGGKDIAIGSRYMAGANTEDWALSRLFMSKVATWIGSFFVPKDLTDPLSGFFIIRRETFLGIVRNISGRGFKILLDIFASANRPLSFVDVPFTFRPRHAGESKMGIGVTWEYLELILEKSVGRLLPIRFTLFLVMGTTGVGVNLAVLGLFYRLLAVDFGFAQVLAIWTAMTFNFFANNLVTYRSKKLTGRRIFYGLLTFYAACSLGAVVSFAVAIFLKDQGFYWALAGFLGAVTGAVWNFATTATFTWGKSARPE